VLIHVDICFRLSETRPSFLPGRAQSSKKSNGKQPIRHEEDEVDEIKSESVSESEAEALLRAARAAHMDDAEFERRNMDRVKAAIERKSTNKGVSPCPPLVFIYFTFFLGRQDGCNYAPRTP
jgi:hypothetical protein